MPDQLVTDDDIDLSPDLMCLVLHRRVRAAAMAASKDDGAAKDGQPAHRRH